MKLIKNKTNIKKANYNYFKLYITFEYIQSFKCYELITIFDLKLQF